MVDEHGYVFVDMMVGTKIFIFIGPTTNVSIAEPSVFIYATLIIPSGR